MTRTKGSINKAETERSKVERLLLRVDEKLMRGPRCALAEVKGIIVKNYYNNQIPPAIKEYRNTLQGVVDRKEKV